MKNHQFLNVFSIFDRKDMFNIKLNKGVLNMNNIKKIGLTALAGSLLLVQYLLQH